MPQKSLLRYCIQPAVRLLPTIKLHIQTKKKSFQYQTITICHHYITKYGTYHSVTAKEVASGLKMLSGKH
jgi:hypothetical protein